MEVVEEKQEGKFKLPILNKTKKNGRLAPMQASWPVKFLMLVVAMAVTSVGDIMREETTMEAEKVEEEQKGNEKKLWESKETVWKTKGQTKIMNR